jgi:predicted dehydrogenase
MSAVRRIALIGFGNVAERGHLPAWLARDDFRIVAVADPNPQRRERAAALLPGARLYEEAADLLAAEAPDAVDVATPPAWHAALAAAAAQAGCHVLCEKPLATTRGGYERLVRAARRAGVAVFTVHNWKHCAQFASATALLAEGAIGRLVDVRLETVRAGCAASVGPAWRQNPALAGGGILVDHGWHAFYLLAGLAGRRPTRVSARLERRGALEAEHTATCRIEFGSLASEIRLTWAGAERRTRWRLGGTDGLVVVEEDWMDLVRGGKTHRFSFPRSLSEGSHHPDWFGAVIDGFVAEIDDPALRGRNLAEADLCLTLTRLAYESDAHDGRPLPVAGVETRPSKQAASFP